MELIFRFEKRKVVVYPEELFVPQVNKPNKGEKLNR